MAPAAAGVALDLHGVGNPLGFAQPGDGRVIYVRNPHGMGTRMSMNGAETKPARAAARNASEFVGDVVTLSELQIKLLSLDLRDGTRKAIWPLALLAAGAGFGVSGSTVLLAAAAVALQQYLPLWGGLLVAGSVGLLLAGTCLAFARRSLSGQVAMLDRSRTEFNKNLQWLKSALSGRPSMHQENQE